MLSLQGVQFGVQFQSMRGALVFRPTSNPRELLFDGVLLSEQLTPHFRESMAAQVVLVLVTKIWQPSNVMAHPWVASQEVVKHHLSVIDTNGTSFLPNQCLEVIDQIHYIEEARLPN
jgi:hypothetical protein